MLKCWNHSTTNRNYAVNNYKTQEKVFLQLGLKNLKNGKKFPKSLKKIVKISIKLNVVGDRLLDSSHEGGGGGGGGGRKGGMCTVSTVGVSS